jgi:hypothetical protein
MPRSDIVFAGSITSTTVPKSSREARTKKRSPTRLVTRLSDAFLRLSQPTAPTFLLAQRMCQHIVLPRQRQKLSKLTPGGPGICGGDEVSVHMITRVALTRMKSLRLVVFRDGGKRQFGSSYHEVRLSVKLSFLSTSTLSLLDPAWQKNGQVETTISSI